MRSSVGTSSAPYVSHFATETVAAGAARANGTSRLTPSPTRAVEPTRNCLRDTAGTARRHDGVMPRPPARSIPARAGGGTRRRARPRFSRPATARHPPPCGPGRSPRALEPRGHRAAGVGHGEDERVQDSGPPVLARGVVELGGARVEEAHPVVPVAHQELRVLGQEVGVRELLAGHGELAATAAGDAEPGEPGAAVFHPSRFPSRRRDQGAALLRRTHRASARGPPRAERRRRRGRRRGRRRAPRGPGPSREHDRGSSAGPAG